MFLWIFVILIAYYLYTSKGHQSIPRSQSLDAKELLDIRYAKGEIDEETYFKMKDTLNR